jgi:hypothetical protein
MTDRETGAREIAHSPMWGFTCGTPAARGNHCSQCNTMTALVMSYGDKRAAGERERCAKVADSHRPSPPRGENMSHWARGFFRACRSVATAIRED